MSDAQHLYEKLTEDEESADELSVERGPDDNQVRITEPDGETLLSPDAARSLADDLEAAGKEEGWYQTGQTKPLVEEIREVADDID